MVKKIIQNKLLFPELLWERPVHYYKAGAGKVLVVSGSKGMAGISILVCEAVFRSGTGILTLGFPDKLKDVYKEILTEAMMLPLPSTPSVSLAKKGEEELVEQSKSCDAAVIGPGLSTNAETIHLVWQLLFRLNIPVVIDGDGVSAIIKGIEVMRAKESEDFLIEYFSKPRAPFIVTATTGEAAKILNTANFTSYKKTDAQAVENHKEEAAQIISDKLKVITVIKGIEVVIAEPKGKIITNKIEGDLSARTQDILSGVVGSFVAQNPNKILEAVATGVYLESFAAKIARNDIPQRQITTSDIIRYLPQAIKESE